MIPTNMRPIINHMADDLARKNRENKIQTIISLIMSGQCNSLSEAAQLVEIDNFTEDEVTYIITTIQRG